MPKRISSLSKRTLALANESSSFLQFFQSDYRLANVRDPPVEDLLSVLWRAGVGGLPLPAVGLEAEPGLGALGTAVQRGFPLAVPHVHVSPLGQEHPGEG